MQTKSLTAQEIDVSHLIEKQQFSCEKIALSATGLIPQYHRDNMPDTLFALMGFWQEHCEGPEPLVRFRILYTIQTNTFSDNWYPDNILTLLDDYRYMVTEYEDQPYYYDYFDQTYFLLDTMFSAFTRNLAMHLQRYSGLEPVEQFFLDFYAHDFTKAMKRLDDGSLEGTRIDSLYRDKKTRFIAARRPYLGIYGGMWRPNSNLAILGNHPQIGIISGVSHNRAVFNFNFMIGFGDTPNYYHVVADNTHFTSKSFLSIHLGFDGGIEIVKTMGSALITTAGLAFEGFEALSLSQQETYGMTRFVGSFNLNVGLEYRFLFSDNSFIGFQTKYHLVNYRNEGGTDLSGNVATFGLVFGITY